MMYRILCLVIFFTISLATDVTVYKSVDYYAGNNVATSRKDFNLRRRNERYYVIRQDSVTSLKINLELSIPKMSCPPKILVAEGRDISQFLKPTAEEYKNIDECIGYICELEVDLRNVCVDHSSASDTIMDDVEITSPVNTLTPDISKFEITTVDNTALHTENASALSSHKVLMYVIPSVIVACGIIFVIYKSVKNYYHRNPVSEDMMEINTYDTVHEVVYADLNFAHGDSHPKPDEEANYAQIIGVLKPADANMEKK